MKNTHLKTAGKIAAFLLGLALCLAGLNRLFRPVWTEWNNYDTIHGFYEEPDNTIETLFLGSSVVINGITPMELYEDYGICAYNMGTQQQPVLVSRFWLEEVYRHHSETLKTVFLDVSTFRRTIDLAMYRKAIDDMQFSDVKYRAVKAYLEDPGDVLTYLFPLTAYHSRWPSLTAQDFSGAQSKVRTYVRGYHYETDYYVRRVSSHTAIPMPAYCLRDTDTTVEFQAEAMAYLQEIIAFCREHDLELILFKTPMIGDWQDSEHNTVAEIAEENGLTFLDFNYDPLFSEIGYNHAIHSTDGDHLNHSGASRLTAWLGHYLVENCGASDVRGNPGYAHMDRQLEEYRRLISNTERLGALTDPAAYVEFALQENYTVFLTVQYEASLSLTEAQRSAFAGMGLTKLSELKRADSYVAAITDGRVICEDVKHESEGSSTSLSWKGFLEDGSVFVLTSGGRTMGNIASCVINDTEYALTGRGLNMVVYDNSAQRIIHAAVFDTYAFDRREPDDLEQTYAEAMAAGIDPDALSEVLQRLHNYILSCAGIRDALPAES